MLLLAVMAYAGAAKIKQKNTIYLKKPEIKNVFVIGDKPHTAFRRNIYSTKGSLVKELPCQLYIML